MNQTHHDADAAPADPSRRDAAAPDPDQARIHEMFHRLPPEIGMLLIAGGVLGLLLPLLPGIPLLVAGGFVLSPKTADRLDDWMKTQFPALHECAASQVARFVHDFEKRYPPGSP